LVGGEWWGYLLFEKMNFRLKWRVLVLKIVKRDKIWGTISISVPHSKFRGTRLPYLIYADGEMGDFTAQF